MIDHFIIMALLGPVCGNFPRIPTLTKAVWRNGGAELQVQRNQPPKRYRTGGVSTEGCIGDPTLPSALGAESHRRRDAKRLYTWPPQGGKKSTSPPSAAFERS